MDSPNEEKDCEHTLSEILESKLNGILDIFPNKAIFGFKGTGRREALTLVADSEGAFHIKTNNKTWLKTS